ncbi:hypothetical protein HPB48_022701 [Haemaphysalis longicornis]|uniref:Uncharacterized protein n=1 Tax=Haemaphysalis longicornis TaxID=44386 RepID=A0A9J6GTY5_HAELO|nr:hypothetical protein HPB48_022701 [Haemaphysalis longicornis]
MDVQVARLTCSGFTPELVASVAGSLMKEAKAGCSGRVGGVLAVLLPPAVGRFVGRARLHVLHGALDVEGHVLVAGSRPSDGQRPLLQAGGSALCGGPATCEPAPGGSGRPAGRGAGGHPAAPPVPPGPRPRLAPAGAPGRPPGGRRAAAAQGK